MSSSLTPIRYASSAWWLVPIFVVVAITVAWMARAPILRGLAEWWVVSDPLDRADAIVILSGRLDVRPFAAAALYQRGMAHQVLFSRAAPGPIDALRLRSLLQQTERPVRYLVSLLGRLGVPDEDMVEFGQNVSSTYAGGEQVNVRIAMPVVGFTRGGTLTDVAHNRVTAFRQGLKEAGFVDGPNVAIEDHWEQTDRLPAKITSHEVLPLLFL
jgi:hypothetical protein